MWSASYHVTEETSRFILSTDGSRSYLSNAQVERPFRSTHVLAALPLKIPRSARDDAEDIARAAAP